jgi:hypothetical protein
MKRCLLLAATAAAALAGGHAAHAQVLNTWVQYGVSGNVLLRSISSNTGSGSVCPTASVDGKHVGMVERFVPDSTFPILECEASVAIGGKQAIIAGVPLKMPSANPKRIVVVGDTGCRIKGTSIQACNDPIAFPTQRIAYYVANYYPDAIIHVGDYYYRESPCPAGSTINCTGSPSGDNWASWNADWFTPAATLITAAPIAHTRGNHESCGRGQQGWYHLMDPFPYSPAAVACAAGSTYDYEPPYTVKMGTTTLLMFDSSYANDSTASNSPTIIANYKNELSQILPTLSGNVIYVTHKPTYGLIQDVNGVVSGGDNDEQNVFSGGVPQPIKLLLSGHIHNYQAVQLTSSAYAPQLVIGNSGTLLDSDGVPTQELGATYQTSPSTTATTVYTADLAEFGFAVLDTTATGYNGSVYDLNGDLLAHCAITLASRTLTCTQ